MSYDGPSQLAWRWWKIGKQGQLMSFNGEIWPPGEALRAECPFVNYAETYTVQQMRRAAAAIGYTPPIPDAHGPVPSLYCSCGIYSVKDSDLSIALWHTEYQRTCDAIGVIEGFGEAVECELGWRFEYAEVRGVHVLRRKLHPVYEVERHRTVEDMVQRWEINDG